MILPRHITLLISHDSADVPTPAAAYQPSVIRDAGSMGIELAIPGGGRGSNCLMPRPSVMSLAPMKVTLPDSSKGTFAPQMPDGMGSLLGVLVAD